MVSVKDRHKTLIKPPFGFSTRKQQGSPEWELLVILYQAIRRGKRKGMGQMAKGKYQKWITPEGLLKIEGWAKDGLTDEQIAGNMGITAKTLYEWKKRYGEICEALKKGKEIVDRQVENALLKRALGYTYTEKMTEKSDIGVKVRITEKEVAPDTTAQIFWLKNRKPEVWRDKKDVTMEGEVPSPFQDLTTEELKKLIQDE